MAATGYAQDDKVHTSGDSMTGNLTLLGTPPLTMPAGADTGYVLTTDANGNVSPAPPPVKVFNLVAYGGVGDGVTDNHASYIAAFSDITNAGGGVLYLPAGRYYSSLPPSPGSYTEIRGDGIDKTILLPSTANTGGNGDGIRTVASSTPYFARITIRDLTVDCSATYPAFAQYGSVPSPASNGITMQGVDDVLVERVKVIKPVGYGVIISSPGGGAAPYVKRPRVRDLYVEGGRGGYDSLGGGGILSGSVDGLYVYPAADGTNPYGTCTDWTNHRNTTVRKVRGWTTFPFSITSTSTPAFPASNTNLVNPFAFPVTVTTSGGTITVVSVNGTSQSLSGTYTLPGFGTISVTYTGSPSWTWAIPAAPSVPSSGTPATNPFAFPVPVNITGGTVSQVQVNGTVQAATTGWFVVPVAGTITLTYSAAPSWTWSTTNASSAVATDFGAVEVLYEDLYLNGFKNGIVISKPANKAYPSHITIKDSRFVNIANDGIVTSVASGLGVIGIRVVDNYFDSYGMLNAAHGVRLFGTVGFNIRGNRFAGYGVSSYAIQLDTDGVNNCDYGEVNGNDVHGLGAFTMNLVGVGSNVAIVNNPGYSLTLPVTLGGTGAVTQQAAINALTGTQSAGKYLRSDGTNASLQTIQAGDLPSGTTGAKGALQLDGTATDIVAQGTQSAGSTGKAADAGHVHPGSTVTYTATQSGISVPAGATLLRVVVVGGGGGGGGSAGSSPSQIGAAGAGGAAGQYVESFVSVSSANTYAVTVGTGGAGGTAGTINQGASGQAGSNGTSSIFNYNSSATVVTAQPGAGGAGGATGTSTGGIGGAYGETGTLSSALNRILGSGASGGGSNAAGGQGGSSAGFCGTGGGGGGGANAGTACGAGGGAGNAAGSGGGGAAGSAAGGGTSPGTGAQVGNSAANNSGAGGGGAGGTMTVASTGAVGAAGGSGGSGFVIVQVAG